MASAPSLGRARRRGAARIVALVVALAASVGACAAIPTTGDVRSGEAVAMPAQPVQPIAEGPTPGDDPSAIVTGFISASAAGVASDFSVARQYLSVEASRNWDPTARVIVIGPGEVNRTWDEDNNIFTLEVPVAATIDETGRMTEAGDSERRTLEFRITRGALDEWRISQLDDGIVVLEALFDSLYRKVPLAFVAADGATIVPDLRWLPENNAATHASAALAMGPAPWLADAVDSGLEPTAALAAAAVPVVNGVAEVDLTEGSVTSARQRGVAESQLTWTLAQLPDVAEVEVTVAGLPIGGDGSTVERGALPDAAAAVVVGGSPGLWDGTETRIVDPADGVLPAAASEPAISYDLGRVAFTLEPQGIGVAALDPEALVPLPGAGSADGALGYDLVVAGPGLAPASFDSSGWLWTAPAVGGSVTAVSSAGEVMSLDVPWLQGRSVQSVRVSRDGARAAVLSRVGDVQAVDIAGIVRDGDGAPVQIGEPLAVGNGITPATVMTWVDDLTVAVLGDGAAGDTPDLFLVTVGGRTSVVSAVAGAVDVTARNGERTLVLTTITGEMHVRTSAGWTRVSPDPEATDVSVAGIAYSG